MLSTIILFAFCLLTGMLALTLCGWVILSGRVFSLDGILLVMLALLIGGILLANVAWSVRTGEFREILEELRQKLSEGGRGGRAASVECFRTCPRSMLP